MYAFFLLCIDLWHSLSARMRAKKESHLRVQTNVVIYIYIYFIFVMIVQIEHSADEWRVSEWENERKQLNVLRSVLKFCNAFIKTSYFEQWMRWPSFFIIVYLLCDTMQTFYIEKEMSYMRETFRLTLIRFQVMFHIFFSFLQILFDQWHLRNMSNFDIFQHACIQCK